MSMPMSYGSERRLTMTDEAGVCRHCLEVRLLDEDGFVGYHDFPLPTRQVCAGARKPPQTAQDRIDRISTALREGDERDLKFLYHKDILVHALMDLGGEIVRQGFESDG